MNKMESDWINRMYQQGFRDGFTSGYEHCLVDQGNPPKQIRFKGRDSIIKQKRKVKQSPKQKLLTEMTKKKWDKYKKGRGKKTYVEIRAEVSRSKAFKTTVRARRL